MIFTLGVEKGRIILETTHLSAVRDEEKGKGGWAAGMGGFSVESGRGEIFVGRENWGETMSRSAEEQDQQDRQGRAHDAETNLSIT